MGWLLRLNVVLSASASRFGNSVCFFVQVANGCQLGIQYLSVSLLYMSRYFTNDAYTLKRPRCKVSGGITLDTYM